MSLKKSVIWKVIITIVIALALVFTGMPVSETYAAAYTKSLTKTVTLQQGETMTWILASKARGEVPLTYNIVSLKGVKKNEKVTINFLGPDDEYSFSISPLKAGAKKTLSSYASNSSTFGAFALVSNNTSGTVKIKLTFHVKSGKNIIKTKEYIKE